MSHLSQPLNSSMDSYTSEKKKSDDEKVYSLDVNSTRIRNVSLRQPKEIGYFSIDIDRNVLINNDSHRSYFYFVHDLHANSSLIEGFSEYKPSYQEEDEHLNFLLASIIDMEKSKGGKKLKADIITWRGIMTNLLMILLEPNSKVELNAVLFDDQIFIEENLPAKVANTMPRNSKGEALAFTGRKFETIATIPKMWADCTRKEIEDKQNCIVNDREQFCSVIKTSIGDVKYIIAGEVDCVYDYIPEPPENPLAHYAELKCTWECADKMNDYRLQKKLARTWAQSFLLGVPNIIYGFRSSNMKLTDVMKLNTLEIPGLIRNSNVLPQHEKWNANKAIEWYAGCLKWIKDTIFSSSSKGKFWRISYNPSGQHGPTLRLFPYDGPNFLTDEFIEWRESLNKKNLEKSD